MQENTTPLNLTFADARMGKPQKVTAIFDRYRDGNGIAIQLVCADGEDQGIPWLTATVNLAATLRVRDRSQLITDDIDRLMAESSRDDVVSIHEENAGIAHLLAENGIIKRDKVANLGTGFVQIGFYELTADAYAEATRQLNSHPVPRQASGG